MKTKQIIISYFENKNLNPNTIRNFLIKNPRINAICTRMINRYPEYENEIKFIKSIVLGIKLRKCIVCGKTLSYKSSVSGALYCSYKCRAKADAEKWKTMTDEEKNMISKKKRKYIFRKIWNNSSNKNRKCKK